MTVTNQFIIKVKETKLNKESLYHLRNIFENHPGNEEIVLQIVSEEDNKVRSLSLKSLKIKYTGLRKGEKLSEQLFFSEEKIIKTEISGILCVSTTPFQTQMKKFDDFISKLNIIKNKALVEEIIKMLPEYKRLS